jgi:hypothetical protein
MRFQWAAQTMNLGFAWAGALLGLWAALRYAAVLPGLLAIGLALGAFFLLSRAGVGRRAVAALCVVLGFVCSSLTVLLVG